jgi:N-acetyl-gamma-glutamyl-phosphate reductase
MRTAAILGTNGYVGQEALDRLLAHPALEVVALGSDSLAGETGAALDVRLNGSLPPFVTNSEALAAGADVLFWCLGHEQAAALVPPPDAVVVDLSGAHRLEDRALYRQWYGFDHPGGLEGWDYALPELFPPTGRLIANPGCYATAALLALVPLAEAIDPTTVVVDAKSGVSGAGREPRPSSHAGVVLDNVSPYRVGTHQHAPEIAQALGFPVTFVPHLLPVRRGLLATCYVDGGGLGLRQLIEDAYGRSPVVRVLPEGQSADLSRVQGTDAAELALFEDRSTGRTIVVCALDNLGKGAAGQAVQNANLALGLPENAGLRLAGVLV